MSTTALTWNNPGGAWNTSEKGVRTVWCFQHTWDTRGEIKFKVKVKLF